MNASVATSLMIASDADADAEVVSETLADEFGQVPKSTNAARAVADFDRHRPAVLVLAFKSVDSAHKYYLGLYRRSSIIHDLPHRTILLCTKDEVRKAYQLSIRDDFDDYVLYWPATFDHPRLNMSVHLAIRALALQAASDDRRDLVHAIKEVAVLEPVLNEAVSRSAKHVQAADREIRTLSERLCGALEDFSEDLTSRLSSLQGGDAMVNAVKAELRSLREEQVGPQLREAARLLAPTHQSLSEITTSHLPRMRSIQNLRSALFETAPSILVVEDEPTQRQLLKKMLETQGYALSYAATGHEALRLALKFPPDLILMDVMLPDTDGLQLTRRIRTSVRLSSIPVLIITGHSEREVVLKSLEAGAVDFLVKPVTRDALRKKVEQHLLRGVTRGPLVNAASTIPP